MKDIGGESGTRGDVGPEGDALTRSGLWPVREHYYISHGELYSHGRILRSYDPLNREELVQEFGRLCEGDLNGLARFAQTWGLLLGEMVVGREGLHPEGEDVPVLLEEEGMSWPPGSDVLHVVWGHLRNVRLILELYQYLKRGDREGLAQFLHSYRVPRTVRGEVIGENRGSSISFFSRRELERVQMRSGGGVPFDEVAPSVAEHTIASILGDHLYDIGYQVAAGPLCLLPRWDFLVHVIYWHLANIVTGSRLLVRCQECGSLFVRTDRRQRFCPAPTGWAGSTGSPCGARARKRRQRQ